MHSARSSNGAKTTNSSITSSYKTEWHNSSVIKNISSNSTNIYLSNSKISHISMILPYASKISKYCNSYKITYK